MYVVPRGCCIADAVLCPLSVSSMPPAWRHGILIKWLSGTHRAPTCHHIDSLLSPQSLTWGADTGGCRRASSTSLQQRPRWFHRAGTARRCAASGTREDRSGSDFITDFAAVIACIVHHLRGNAVFETEPLVTGIFSLAPHHCPPPHSTLPTERPDRGCNQPSLPIRRHRNTAAPQPPLPRCRRTSYATDAAAPRIRGVWSRQLQSRMHTVCMVTSAWCQRQTHAPCGVSAAVPMRV
eukprot:353244-Chlamydomonas_euryale.AAC.7